MSIEELRRTADRWDLLTHSFYRRWTRGELSREELQDYACQYHLVVSAMPRWLSDAANRDVAHRDVLAAHARDEAAHIKLWADFALAVGVMPDELDRTVPNEATRALLARGDALVAGDRGAAVVWALEAQNPRVSDEKLAGLRAHYGIRDGKSARYFEVHRQMDVRHAEELEGVIASDPVGLAAAPVAAREMLQGLWELLSSVEKMPASAC